MLSPKPTKAVQWASQAWSLLHLQCRPPEKQPWLGALLMHEEKRKQELGKTWDGFSPEPVWLPQQPGCAR